MFYTEAEIEAIKQDIGFSKEDLEKIIKRAYEQNSLSEDVYNKLLKEASNIKENIIPDFSDEAFMGYCINFESCIIEKVLCSKLCFDYDNESKQLYVLSFILEKEQPNKPESLFGEMRDFTSEESEIINKYLDSISKPTGINIFDLFDEKKYSIDAVNDIMSMLETKYSLALKNKENCDESEESIKIQQDTAELCKKLIDFLGAITQ